VSNDLLAPAVGFEANSASVLGRDLPTEYWEVKGGMGGTTVAHGPWNAKPLTTRRSTNAGCAQRARDCPGAGHVSVPAVDCQPRSEAVRLWPMRVEALPALETVVRDLSQQQRIPMRANVEMTGGQ
jgi:hypothetical protein